MQKSVKKALLRKILINQCRKQNRTPLPLSALPVTITIPPPLPPQLSQVETQNQNNPLVTQR
jgi:hypothetical protein